MIYIKDLTSEKKKIFTFRSILGRTEREVLTLQISDSTDARLLLGLYRYEIAQYSISY